MFPAFILLTLFFTMNSYAESHHPVDFIKSIQGTKDEGEQIYNHFCVNCHAKKPLINLGAPRIDTEEDWKLRLDAGIEPLWLHTSEGLNAMPARGGCFECSDEQLVLAIVEMAPKKTQKDLLIKLKDYNKIIK